MKRAFHVDMSGRIYENKNIGIAVVNPLNSENYGCVLKGNLIKLIKKNLFKSSVYRDYAKLYAICIYLLIKDITDNMDILIICNDEDFSVVKETLQKLLKNISFKIINITEFRKDLGRNIGSLADNYARAYRKRALNPSKWDKGKTLNVKSINYTIIKENWEIIK